jgi:hypothetical protein
LAGDGSGTETKMRVFWRRAAGSSESTPTVSDEGNHTSAVIVTIRGCETSGNPYDIIVEGTDDTEDTSVSITGGTTTVNDCLVVAVCSRGADILGSNFVSWTNGDLSGFAEKADGGTNQGNGGGIGVAAGGLATAGTFGATAVTLGTTSANCFMHIAFKEPATGPTAGTDPVLPEPPTEAKVKINWGDSADNTGAYVQRNTVQGFTPDAAHRISSLLGADIVTYTDTTPSAETQYYYVVEWVDAVGSTNSGEVAAKTAPAIPTAIAFSSVTQTSIAFQLTIPATSDDNAARVYVLTPAEVVVQIFDLQAAANEAIQTVYGLMAGTVYTFKAQAYDPDVNSGLGAYSTFLSDTQATNTADAYITSVATDALRMIGNFGYVTTQEPPQISDSDILSVSEYLRLIGGTLDALAQSAAGDPASTTLQNDDFLTIEGGSVTVQSQSGPDEQVSATIVLQASDYLSMRGGTTTAFSSATGILTGGALRIKGGNMSVTRSNSVTLTGGALTLAGGALISETVAGVPIPNPPASGSVLSGNLYIEGGELVAQGANISHGWIKGPSTRRRRAWNRPKKYKDPNHETGIDFISTVERNPQWLVSTVDQNVILVRTRQTISDDETVEGRP